ncbi:disease resistance protein (TIR-NBS-LRR class) [Trifolium pratense]|uniref:Disease resistance protein (TIR-NBS-LRR class) n=1 Tax=Trifolium pratense TaxID=57577 RepID=A0A2K3MJC5_TRIPR|nr:disease resistance protein (TIR-NBS-LRR class) [Trifolium pratense]
MSSSYTDKKKYDVFLSFRGEDTRASFTSHLHASLQKAGIHDFRDDDSLKRGENIYTILQAIEDSRIAIIIFSKKYADSRWCLQELEKIMECSKTKGQIVLPVFYDVDPSEVRHQTGEFGKGFQSLLSRVKEDHEFLESSMGVFPYEDIKWTESLREVASIAGFLVLNSR